MEASEIRLGQRVRWRTIAGSRTGQIYSIHRFSNHVIVYWFDGLHRDWVRQEIAPEDLEAVHEEAEPR